MTTNKKSSNKYVEEELPWMIMSENARSSPGMIRRYADSCMSSPARSVASKFTDSDFDPDGEFVSTGAIPIPDLTIISGWLKFRDNKKVGIYIYLYLNFNIFWSLL